MKGENYSSGHVEAVRGVAGEGVDGEGYGGGVEILGETFDFTGGYSDYEGFQGRESEEQQEESLER